MVDTAASGTFQPLCVIGPSTRRIHVHDNFLLHLVACAAGAGTPEEDCIHLPASRLCAPVASVLFRLHDAPSPFRFSRLEKKSIKGHPEP